ncbi:MAG: acetolactate synthase small subunit [Chitinophagales bacterium]|nr:acetolactate synthase small subunit [Bacteroidota bacterium]MCB9042352.1 acetolactate synthase small subunit [Chitinophagales bacterium]
MEEKLFTISIFTENHIGILNRITVIFTRRHLNIDSITASESEIKDVHRYTIVLKTSYWQVEKVIAQIDKLIDVLKVFVHEDEDIIYQEIALYKLKNQLIIQSDIEKVIRENHARVLSVSPEYIVIEKTGHTHETQQLFDKLKMYGILEFVRSGRVAVTKPMKELSSYLKEIEENQP